MNRLILLRHGQSLWNALDIFTGWVDIPLSTAGIQEAFAAGEKIKDLPIDIVFTSTLIRAQMTAMLALSVHSSKKVPVIQHAHQGKLELWGHIHSKETEATTIPVVQRWELNERMYGELQGMNKTKMREQFGAEQVKLWRRSYDIAPPKGESLAMTAERALPYFNKKIMPALKQGKNVLVSAHGNSLRAIMMSLDQLSHEEVVQLEIPTGVPILYTFTPAGLVKEKPL